MEFALFYSLILWFAFYMVNHAVLFDKQRQALFAALPNWLSYALSCSLCFATWVLVAVSLFWGFTPIYLVCPPGVLFTELVYQKLK